RLCINGEAPSPGPQLALLATPSPPAGRGKASAIHRTQTFAGRSLATSAGPGSTDAPSTYLKSTMVPLPFSSAILPTKQPIVAWWSLARYSNGPNGLSTLRPLNASTSFSVSVDLALAMAATADLMVT